MKRMSRQPLSSGSFAGKSAFPILMMLVLGASLALITSSGAIARQSVQQEGALDFNAHISPSAGRAEPVRGMAFYLLRKSFAEIQKEADAAEPPPKMDEYIDGLKFTPEFKTWMRKHQMVEFSGTDFVEAIAPEDVLNIPELKEAYMTRNAGDRTVVLPQPKFKEADRQRHPEKFQQQVDEYHEALKKFIAANPGTLSSMYLALEKTNPGPEWRKILTARKTRVHRHALELAELHYLAGQTDTDLEGHGRIDNVPPGEYWLTTLEMDAISGDARVRWDLPVRITAGRSHFELSNLNGIEKLAP